MIAWTSLRLLATLKRIAKALEEANALKKRELEPIAAPKMSTIDVPKAADWNDAWVKRHEQAEINDPEAFPGLRRR